MRGRAWQSRCCSVCSHRLHEQPGLQGLKSYGICLQACIPICLHGPRGRCWSQQCVYVKAPDGRTAHIQRQGQHSEMPCHVSQDGHQMQTSAVPAEASHGVQAALGSLPGAGRGAVLAASWLPAASRPSCHLARGWPSCRSAHCPALCCAAHGAQASGEPQCGFQLVQWIRHILPLQQTWSRLSVYGLALALSREPSSSRSHPLLKHQFRSSGTGTGTLECHSRLSVSVACPSLCVCPLYAITIWRCISTLLQAPRQA